MLGFGIIVFHTGREPGEWINIRGQYQDLGSKRDHESVESHRSYAWSAGAFLMKRREAIRSISMRLLVVAFVRPREMGKSRLVRDVVRKEVV
jgi:hypothetical protein